MASLKKCPYCFMKYWSRSPNQPCSYCNGVTSKDYLRNERNITMAKKNENEQTGDTWEVKIDTVSECSKAPGDITVKIALEAKLKIDSLMEKFPNIEWLAYLIGRAADEEADVKADPLHIVDIHIPTQQITATSVDNIECEEFNNLNIVGVIHSHHGMGTGFSGTDHAFINGNHNLSLVIAKNGVAGQYRWTTPCGSLKIVDDVKVKVIYPDFGFDKDSWLEEETKKIKKYVAPVSNYQYGVYQAGQAGYSHLNHSQQKYKGPGSIKKNDAWQTNDDDVPEFDQGQSLQAALDEAFDD
jgi:hypothetical protein